MQKLSKEEFEYEYPELSEIYGKAPVNFYVAENPDCPCIGVEYSNGEIWIYGAKYDKKIEDADELEWYLSLT